MSEEKSLFERMDDISVKQAEILDQVIGIRKQTENADAHILALEQEIQRLKVQPQSVVSQPKPQNQVRQQSDKEILHQFLKQSKKSWRWFGNKKEFKKSKNLAVLSIVFLFIIGLITTIVSSICFELYSTFTLFENIWLIFGIVYLCYIIKAQLKYEVKTMASSSSYKYEEDDVGMLFPRKEKVVFRVFKWFALISTILNIICIWTVGKKVKGVATLMEVLFLITIILAWVAISFFHAQYSIVYVDGFALTTKEKVTLVFDPVLKQLVPEEEYKNKMQPLYE